jgi:hypothetical protein
MVRPTSIGLEPHQAKTRGWFKTDWADWTWCEPSTPLCDPVDGDGLGRHGGRRIRDGRAISHGKGDDFAWDGAIRMGMDGGDSHGKARRSCMGRPAIVQAWGRSFMPPRCEAHRAPTTEALTVSSLSRQLSTHHPMTTIIETASTTTALMQAPSADTTYIAAAGYPRCATRSHRRTRPRRASRADRRAGGRSCRPCRLVRW